MEKWNNVELNSIRKTSCERKHDVITSTTNELKYNNNSICNENDIIHSKSSELMQPGSNIKPVVDDEQVESLLQRLYGITTREIKELISYDDRNYMLQEDRDVKNPLIISHWPHGYVLKILNALDSKKTNFIDAQNQLMIYLSKQGITCPRPIANLNGNLYSVERISGVEHVVRLLEYIPGQIFHEVPTTNYLLYQSGEYLAKIDQALKNFHHNAYETHKTLWMLQSVPQLREFVYVLKNEARKRLIEEIIDAFESKVLVELNNMEQQIIHGDFNEQNILVERRQTTGNSITDLDHCVTGIIDFGDTNKSPLIFEVGIALAYMMLQAKSLESGGIFLAGYKANQSIMSEEEQYLKYCVAARLAQSLVLGAYTHSLHPSNAYVLVTQEQGWTLIEQLWKKAFDQVDDIWQNAADKYLTEISE